MRERILHQLVNRLNVVRTEGCNVGRVGGKHFIFGRASYPLPDLDTMTEIWLG